MSYPYRRTDIKPENREFFKMVFGIYGELNEWWSDIDVPDDIVNMVERLYARVVCNTISHYPRIYGDIVINSSFNKKELAKEVKSRLEECKRAYGLISLSNDEYVIEKAAVLKCAIEELKEQLCFLNKDDRG